MAEIDENLPDLTEIDAEQFARLLADASDEEIEALVNGPSRSEILDEIFSRMADHVQPAQIADLETVVHFRILDRPEDQGGGDDHYEVIFSGGTCRASGSPEHEPQVTISTSGVQFLNMAAGKATGPTLFLNGKLKLEGDVMLASRLTSFFRIPNAT